MNDTTPVSPLRQRRIEDMTARQLGPHSQRSHIYSCKRFAAFLKRSPDTATRVNAFGFMRARAEACRKVRRLQREDRRADLRDGRVEPDDRAGQPGRQLGVAPAVPRRQRLQLQARGEQPLAHRAVHRDGRAEHGAER